MCFELRHLNLDLSLKIPSLKIPEELVDPIFENEEEIQESSEAKNAKERERNRVLGHWVVHESSEAGHVVE